MKKDNMPQVARFWNDIAEDFDTIYTGRKGAIGRRLDQWLRKDIYQRFDWVMERAGDVRGQEICDIGCGSGRFVTEFVKRGAKHDTGVDVAPEMLRLSKELVTADGTADKCDFVLSDSLHWKTTNTLRWLLMSFADSQVGTVFRTTQSDGAHEQIMIGIFRNQRSDSA